MPHSKKRSRPSKAIKLPPTAAEARDAGPRLIPLDVVETAVRAQYRLELADIALGTQRPEPKRSTRARRLSGNSGF